MLNLINAISQSCVEKRGLAAALATEQMGPRLSI